MTFNRVFDIMASIVAVAAITALVLPGRRTPEVINSAGRAFSNSISAAQGRN